MTPSEKYYKDILRAIYPCKVSFTLVVKSDKPKKRIGTYFGASKRIILYQGWAEKHDLVETAIHEYAHHLHYTEFHKSRRERPHGPRFWQIYGQLTQRAVALGFLEEEGLPILRFPKEKQSEAKRPGELHERVKKFFRSAYEWLNRE